MSARQPSSSSLEVPEPPRGACPGCGQEPGGERCTHCGVAARVGPYRVRKVLGLAIEESGRLGHDHIGTEHLLLGIIHEGEGVANVILEKAGALEKVARVRTLTLLDQQRDAEGRAPKDQD